MGALWHRHVDGAWFPSVAVTGRAIAAAAVLGILEACAAALDVFVPSGVSSRQSVILALLRCADIPVAAALNAVMSGDSQAPVLSSLPISLGLACSWLLCECYGRKEDTFRSHPGDALLITAAAVATVCRALRCAGGAFLLRRVGVDNSWGGLFFVGGFSGFFGSMLVLPLTLGQLPLKSIDWDADSFHAVSAVQLDFSVVAVAALGLGAVETLSRLAVLRHSDTVTAASLDAGILPLAAVMARSLGMAQASPDRYVPADFLALATLLLSSFIQLRSSHCRRCSQLGATENPVLLGRAQHGLGEVRESFSGSRKLRQV